MNHCAYTAEIDRWLRYFFDSDALLDWMAVAPDSKRSLPALVITGPQGTGKSLLTRGLAKVWDPQLQYLHTYIAATEAPAVPRLVYGFEADLSFIRAHQKCDPLAAIRKGVRTTTHRFVVEARNLRTLARYAHGPEFLRLTVNPNAARYLFRQHPERLDQWEKQRIAQHTLWLALNRRVDNVGPLWGAA